MTNDEARWRQYFFGSHSEDTLRKWAGRLRLFRYVRAYGGHANDGDDLRVIVAYKSLTELEAFMALLGVKLRRFDTQPPQMIPGRAYTWAESSQIPSLIPETTWIQQPGWSEACGHRVFIHCTKDTITLNLADQFDVTEQTVVAAEDIEKVLVKSPLHVLDPPVDSKHCLCPQHHPDVFE